MTLHGVRVRFPARRAPTLEGVDLAVRPGEQVLLAGASGCGKSTLLALLAGHVPQSVAADVDGDVEVLGRDPRTTPVAQLALQVGRLGQDPASGTCLPTVAGDVALVLENRGVPPELIAGRVDAALADAGAGHLRHRRTGDLSGGEQQRVALAAVLAGDPALLLLDEPTSMLDPVAAAHVLGVLAREARRRTTVLTAHRLPDGAWRPGRVVRLADGRVASDELAVAPPPAAPGGGAVPGGGAAPGGGAVPGGRSADEPPGVRDGGRAAGWRRVRRGAGEPVVVLRGAGYARDGRAVVAGVDLELRPGQVTAVVGCNGSGKSSLLLGLAGFLDADGRSDVVGAAGPGGTGAAGPGGTAGGGSPGTASPPALVLQHPEQQLLTRSVADEVAWGLLAAASAARRPPRSGRGRRAGASGWASAWSSAWAPHRAGPRRGRAGGRPADDAARARIAADVDAALARAGLTHLAAADPYRLSGGEQRRLAVAAMSVLRRPVLLLDEPTCGLDDAAARGVVALVDDLAAAGTAVVLATHDLDLARGVADQVLVLGGGTPLAVGDAGLLDDAGLLRAAGLRADPWGGGPWGGAPWGGGPWGGAA
ncbi:ABC transporter ATP-binding protein [Actinotalea solisilvae]|uniref:ABC transporter ATP-binding protein n=1 Tax=Actinotalea solisilvae TaxID=2072922 RepID=UPI0018F229B3|nr:ABC transporter ATP-binding protein [Actinotalea solisilvae]